MKRRRRKNVSIGKEILERQVKRTVKNATKSAAEKAVEKQVKKAVKKAVFGSGEKEPEGALLPDENEET